jgi:hypothetical protein
MDDEPLPMQFVASLESVHDFFGAEPRLEYDDVPYEENVVSIEAELEHGRVRFKFMPSQGWAELSLVAKPFSLVRLNFADISSMSIRKTPEDHTMLIRFDRAKTSDFKLYLRPTVLLFWGNEGPSPGNGADLELAADDSDA